MTERESELANVVQEQAARIAELEAMLEQAAAELQLHNEEYKHVTSKDFINRIRSKA